MWTRIVLLLAAVLTMGPGMALAAGGEGQGAVSRVLFALGVLLLAANLGGLAAERLGQPPVLGELVIGIVLASLVVLLRGAEAVAYVQSEPTLQILAEVGVLILLFDVGLETDIRALVRVGPSALLVALIGVAAPLTLGWGVAAWLLPGSPQAAHIFVGAALSATSVGITARVLKDLGKTQSPEGRIILGAAILDDVMGLIVLALVSGLATAAAGGRPLSLLAVAGIVGRAVVFLGLVGGLGHFLSKPIVQLAARAGHPEIMLAVGLFLCFTLAYAAELIGLAGIIGAFAAGLILDPYGEGVRAREGDRALSELLHPFSTLIVPLFFVLMGIKVDLGSLASGPVFALAAALTACALAGKLVCGLGVVDRGVSRLAVGIGMLPRGEVGLIFAGIGTTLVIGGRPVFDQRLFSAVVLMVLVTTIVAPAGLRWAFGRRSEGSAPRAVPADDPP
jgi:Kef-type K+ transport system membrane component KefB